MRDLVRQKIVRAPGSPTPRHVRWMVRHLLGNAAGTFSIQRFYADLRSQGIPVAKDTLHDYLGHLEDAFLVRTLPIAAESERRRMVNPRKVYPVDPGLIPLFDRAGRAQRGPRSGDCRGAGIGAAGGDNLRGTGKGLKSTSFRDTRTTLSNSSRSALISTRPALAAANCAVYGRPRPSTRATAHLIALTVEGLPPLPDQVRLHRAAEWLLQA